MDYNAINQCYAAKRDDGRWGIANDFTGKSRYQGKAFATELEALCEAARINGQLLRTNCYGG